MGRHKKDYETFQKSVQKVSKDLPNHSEKIPGDISKDLQEDFGNDSENSGGKSRTRLCMFKKDKEYLRRAIKFNLLKFCSEEDAEALTEASMPFICKHIVRDTDYMKTRDISPDSPDIPLEYIKKGFTEALKERFRTDSLDRP